MAVPVNYTELPPARPPRSIAMWMLLFGVWAVGLMVWCLYLAAFSYLLIRFLS